MVAPASHRARAVVPSPTLSGTVRPGRQVLRFPVERRHGARGAAVHPAGASPGPGRSVRVRRGPAPAPALRLTRRGRAVLWALSGLLLLALVAGGVLLGARTASAGRDARPLPVSYRVVRSGETLWQIAGQVAPQADRRDTVAYLVELNALPGASVQAGQQIAVPRRQGS